MADGGIDLFPDIAKKNGAATQRSVLPPPPSQVSSRPASAARSMPPAPSARSRSAPPPRSATTSKAPPPPSASARPRSAPPPPPSNQKSKAPPPPPSKDLEITIDTDFEAEDENTPTHLVVSPADLEAEREDTPTHFLSPFEKVAKTTPHDTHVDPLDDEDDETDEPTRLVLRNHMAALAKPTAPLPAAGRLPSPLPARPRSALPPLPSAQRSLPPRPVGMPASAPPRAPARPPLAPAFPEPRGAAPLALPSLTSDPAAASLPTSPRSVPVPLIRPRPETAPHLAPEARSFPPVTLGGGAPTSVRRTGKRGAIGAAVALLAALAASVAVFTGADETGALVVTVSGPGSASVEGVEVIADDVARCETAPCRIQDLPAGTHFVKVSAKGYAPTAARAVAVQSGGDTTIHIELSRPPSEPVATTSERSEPPAAKPRRPAEAQTLAVADLAAQDVDTAAPAARAAPASRRNGAGRTTPPAAPKPAVAATGTLNIDSNPAASVVVDGRPVGRTPLVGLSVSAGPHTVTFIHPEKGRTTKAAVVEPGKPATISARF